jgi:hypothetical protein
MHTQDVMLRLIHPQRQGRQPARRAADISVGRHTRAVCPSAATRAVRLGRQRCQGGLAQWVGAVGTQATRQESRNAAVGTRAEARGGARPRPAKRLAAAAGLPPLRPPGQGAARSGCRRGGCSRGHVSETSNVHVGWDGLNVA